MNNYFPTDEGAPDSSEFLASEEIASARETQDISIDIDKESMDTEKVGRLTFATQAVGIGAWDWDMESGQVLWSDSLQALHGLEPGTFGGTIEAVMQPIHPDDHILIHNALQHSIANGTEQVLEYRITWPDGSLHWLDSRGRVLYNAEGRPVRLCGVATDITARKEAESARLRSEERYRLLAENSLDLIGLLNLQGQVIYASPSHHQVLGYPADVLVDHSLFDIAHPEDKDKVSATVGALLETGGNATRELRLRHQDGHWITVEAIFSLVDNSNAENETGGGQNEERRILLSARDITERQQTAQRLLLLESAVVHSKDTVLITEAGLIDKPGPRILYVNEAFTQMTGYTAQEAVGRSPRFLQGAATSRESCAQIREALGNYQPITIELQNYRKDGTPFWVQMSIVPIANQNGDYTQWVSIQRDVTERRRDEERLQEAKAEAERANLAKSEFLSRMSHELRTPLNAILGFSQLMQLDERPPGDIENINHVIKAGRHLLALIDEVLHISRIESGHLSLSIEPVPVWELLSEAADLLQPSAREHGVTLHLDQNCDVFMLADRQRLKQILLNLLSNAIKYNRRDGEVHLSCEHNEERAAIFVRDSGYGLSPEQQERLFTPFDRLGADATGIEGTGIGLALSYRLARAMNGDITVQSETGKGSTFCLDMPYAEAFAALLENSESGPFIERSAALAQPTCTLLYIEDNLPNLNLVETILRRHAEVRLLASMQGRMGLEMAREHRPDLILLDLHLPDISGEEVLAQLCADPRTRDIPVVVLSADAVPARIQRLIAAGARTYLTKPLHIQQFLDVLEKNLPAR